MVKIKKRLTIDQEFQIMKLVLDKFLWLGTIMMAFGLYRIYNADVTQGIIWIVTGAIVLIIFMILIVKEFEIIK
jgi:hypothetical protein